MERWWNNQKYDKKTSVLAVVLKAGWKGPREVSSRQSFTHTLSRAPHLKQHKKLKYIKSLQSFLQSAPPCISQILLPTNVLYKYFMVSKIKIISRAHYTNSTTERVFLKQLCHTALRLQILKWLQLSFLWKTTHLKIFLKEDLSKM